MERSTELEDLTRELYAAVSNGDAGFFERHLSRGETCVVIGTAPDEWWEDYSTALGPIRRQMASVGVALELVEGNIRAFHSGGVGWVADRPTIKLANKAVLCRHTSVFEREESGWRIVQHHFSIGVANEVVFGNEARKLE
ncbi:MAG TPA: nuclear transport factor 2 family protein [Pyrinomonadaceae bacterium]|nr:nuclear transport factor 2 family protein [Pyrinomonadaceae bacterium]